MVFLPQSVRKTHNFINLSSFRCFTGKSYPIVSTFVGGYFNNPKNHIQSEMHILFVKIAGRKDNLFLGIDFTEKTMKKGQEVTIIENEFVLSAKVSEQNEKYSYYELA